VPELREEVESIIATEGWGKAATEKMHKLDSFIKESQRFFGLGVCERVFYACVFDDNSYSIFSDYDSQGS
jgi:hypothetical protein